MQWQHLQRRQRGLLRLQLGRECSERRRRRLDLLLPCEEYEHVTRPHTAAVVAAAAARRLASLDVQPHRELDRRLEQLRIAAARPRSVEDLHGVAPAGHAQHGRVKKVAAQPPRVERGGGDDHSPWAYSPRLTVVALASRRAATPTHAVAITGTRAALALAPSRCEQALHRGKEHVRVERPLVRLVQDERVNPR